MGAASSAKRWQRHSSQQPCDCEICCCATRSGTSWEAWPAPRLGCHRQPPLLPLGSDRVGRETWPSVVVLVRSKLGELDDELEKGTKRKCCRTGRGGARRRIGLGGRRGDFWFGRRNGRMSPILAENFASCVDAEELIPSQYLSPSIRCSDSHEQSHVTLARAHLRTWRR